MRVAGELFLVPWRTSERVGIHPPRVPAPILQLLFAGDICIFLLVRLCKTVGQPGDRIVESFRLERTLRIKSNHNPTDTPMAFIAFLGAIMWKNKSWPSNLCYSAVKRFCNVLVCDIYFSKSITARSSCLGDAACVARGVLASWFCSALFRASFFEPLFIFTVVAKPCLDFSVLRKPPGNSLRWMVLSGNYLLSSTSLWSCILRDLWPRRSVSKAKCIMTLSFNLIKFFFRNFGTQILSVWSGDDACSALGWQASVSIPNRVWYHHGQPRVIYRHSILYVHLIAPFSYSLVKELLRLTSACCCFFLFVA